MRSMFIALSLALAAALPAAAQPKADAHAGHHGAASASASAPGAGELADGEVRRVDLDGTRLTLKHGEIKSLDMPPMTMVFGVRDKALLDGVKAGDKVRFRAVIDAGKYTITELQVVR